MRVRNCVTLVLFGLSAGLSFASPNDWRGRSVVFLGDSITDKSHIGCTTNYWGFFPRGWALSLLSTARMGLSRGQSRIRSHGRGVNRARMSMPSSC